MSIDRPSVAVVGSYGVGMWIQSPRFPAKGETVLGSGFSSGHGGKGSNQAIGAARLGVRVVLLACVGDDAFGADALELWRREGVDATAVVTTSDAATMVGFILLDPDGDNRIVTDPGANSLLSPEHLEGFAVAAGAGHVLLTQMEIPVPTVAAALDLGRRHGVTTILNPAPATPLPRELLRRVDILTPNQTEARVLAGLAPDDPRPDRDVAALILGQGVRTVVLTLGDQGAMIVTDDGYEHCEGQPVAVVDTTGAGDGFNAALAAAVAEGRELRDAVERANHAGAHVVTKRGVVEALPQRAQLEAALQASGSTAG